MAIFKIDSDKIEELESTSFAFEKIHEIGGLQKLIVNSIEKIDPNLLVISTEFSDWEESKKRIDILCVDTDANLVVVELKRTEDGGYMELQAIRYSAMIANMTFEKAIKTYSKYLQKNNIDKNAEEELLKFLEWDEVLEEDFGKDVKIILISADFSKELTTSILWLTERNIDIRCIRIKPQKDSDRLYLDIQQMIPLPETSEYQVKLNEKVDEERKARKESKRAKSIIFHLFESGKLQIGDKLILKPAKEQGHDIGKVTAEIVNNKQSCLKRSNDDTLYSLSKLRKVLTNELNLRDVKPGWGFALKHDWITEDGKDLAELIKNG